MGLKNCSLRESCSRNMGSVMGGGRRDAEMRWGCGVLERRMAVAVAGSRWGVEVKANNFTGISNSSTAVVCYTGFYCVTGLCGRPMKCELVAITDHRSQQGGARW